MKNLYLILCIFLMNILFSQNLQNTNWTFGNNNLVTFLSSGTPTASTISPLAFSIYHQEGVASVSDSAGNLLLYSDGNKLWHVSGGVSTLVTSALIGSTSSAQNLIFIPKPNTPNRYMLVYIHGGTDLQLGLFYSEIDFSGVPFMVSLNVPLLDFSGNPIDNTISYYNMSEALTSTIHADGNSYWIVAAVQAWPNYSISMLSYLLTQNGFQNLSGTQNVPVKETVYPIADNAEFPLGVKISRDTKKIAMTTSDLSFVAGFMGNFDNATGVVSPVAQITDPIPYTMGYGLEFSPNSSLLYYTTNNSGVSTIYQLETQNWSQVGVLSSTTQKYIGLQLGLDDNVYVASTQNNLFIINNPDSISSTLTLGNLTLNNPSGSALPQWVWEHGNCFDTLNENTDVLNGEVDHEERIDWIKAENIINLGGEALYHAGNYLQLDPGFEAQVGSKFAAYIADCNSGFAYRHNHLVKNDSDARAEKEDFENGIGRSLKQIKIYPNPSSTNITVAYTSNLKSITILSMDGKTMLSRNVSTNATEIDVSAFANGIYLISTETLDGKTLQSKFIKN